MGVGLAHVSILLPGRRGKSQLFDLSATPRVFVTGLVNQVESRGLFFPLWMAYMRHHVLPVFDGVYLSLRVLWGVSLLCFLLLDEPQVRRLLGDLGVRVIWLGDVFVGRLS